MFTTLGCTTYAVWGQELCDYVREGVDQHNAFMCIFAGMKAIRRKKLKAVYKNGGKPDNRSISPIMKYLEAEAKAEGKDVSEELKRFYESGYLPEDYEYHAMGRKDASPESIRKAIKFALYNYDNRRDSSGKLKAQDQITYDYFNDLLKLSDEELPRSYRMTYGKPAQFYDTSDMDELQPRGAGSMSTDDLNKELQESGASIADNSRRREPRLIYKASDKTRTGQEPSYYRYFDSKGNPKMRPVEPEEYDRYMKENRIRKPQFIRASF